MDDLAFENLRETLSIFRDTVFGMSTEEKRAAIRGVVHKVIWDGTKAHAVLFGAEKEKPLS